MKSKSKKILEALQAGEVLNQLHATKRFKTTRLGGIIHSLRKQGYDIKTNLIPNKRGAPYAEYYM